MARGTGCNLAFVLFIVACVLLFSAFNTNHGESVSKWQSSNFLSKGHGSDDLAAKLRKSEALYAESIKGRQEMRATYEKDPKNNRRFPKDYIAPYNLYDFVYPAFNCPHELERVGRFGDGGKWVCGMTKYESNRDRPCVIYAFGVNDDSSFENAMLRRTNCEIWGYDYSVASWGAQLDKSYASRAHFTRAGISNATDETRSPPFFSVRDLMRKNGHVYIDIMKMDIEASEFDATAALLRDFAGQELPVGQFLLETHMREVEKNDPFSLPRTLGDWIAFWESLEARGMRVFSVEPNLLGNNWYKHEVFAEVSMLNINDQKSLLVH